MHKLSSAVISLIGIALLAGCASPNGLNMPSGPERKLGRGLNNMAELIRMGELRRSIEEAAVLESPDLEFTTGAIHGVDRTVARTAYGFYEVFTFPFANHSPKNYDAIFLPENPVYPDSYSPNILADQMTSPDASLGFGGGDIVPMIMGSRFHIFDQ
jgi:putative exosortase-associated protein (TIGR04073 family)